jgi:hypothetical protein
MTNNIVNDKSRPPQAHDGGAERAAHDKRGGFPMTDEEKKERPMKKEIPRGRPIKRTASRTTRTVRNALRHV